LGKHYVTQGHVCPTLMSIPRELNDIKINFFFGMV
jgi:hypothetical protein